MRGRLLVISMALAVAAAACSDAGVEPSNNEDPTTTGASSTTSSVVITTSTTSAPTTTNAPTIPATTFDLDDHITWILELLNGAGIDEAGYEARFDDPFRAQVPFAQFTPILDQLPGLWSQVALNRSPNGTEAVVLIENEDGLRLNVSLAVGTDPSNRLGGLFLAPAPLDDPPESLEALAERWDTLAPTASLLIANVTDGTCPVDGTHEVLPIGSAFKLWVLGALAEAVAAGSVAWGDTVVVRDDLKSLPSGVLQDEPAGTELSVLEMAELMISISDNTATDHLIDLLGRGAVEEAMVAMGHAMPQLNRPFLMTREVFHLKVLADDATRQSYIDGDEATRRSILDGLTIDLVDFDLEEFVEGVYDADTLEWFGSTIDVCRGLIWLQASASRDGLAPVRTILSINPGVAIDGATWPWVGFKGGSEPGVLSLSWIAERIDGEVFVIAGILFDATGGIDEITSALLLEHAFTLLADA